jgi:hypothetical protein
MGLVESGSNPHETQVRQLSLSAAGARLEARLTATQAARNAAAFAAAGPDATAGWLAVMRCVSTAMPPDGAAG